MSEVDDLKKSLETLHKEFAAFRKAVSEGKDLKGLIPVKVDTTYLCPKDPNRDKVLKNNGMVTSEDGPLHLNGWITKIDMVKTKHNAMGPDGRPFQFENVHKVATWKCQQDGSELTLDPYLK